MYLLDAVLWGAILLSLVLPWLSVMSLSASLRLIRGKGSPDCPGPTEGEAVQIELWLENGKFWPRFLLSLSYYCPPASPEERWQRFLVPRLDRGVSPPSVSVVNCYRRGLHQFGPVNVESKAPFGLFRRRKRLANPLSVLVYPQVYPLQRLALLEGIQGTALRPRRIRTGQEISASRPYVLGDPLRHIHWRNTARVGSPMVKEFEDTQEDTLVIMFDSSRDLGEERETVLEYTVKLAASVARCVVERGANVRVLTGNLPGHEMPWTLLLKELALLEAGQGPSLRPLLENLAAGSEDMILAFVSDTDTDGIEALTGRAAHMPRLAVVALEGFGDPPAQRARLALEALTMNGVPVVRCRRGELPETLRDLELVEWSTGAQMHWTAAKQQL